MTTPVIDVDFAVPSASVAVGMPSVDVSVPGTRGPSGVSHQNFGMFGDVSARVGEIPWFPRHNGRILRVTASVSAQTSGQTVVDLIRHTVANPAGTSVFTSPGHKPTMSAAGLQFDDGAVDLPDFGDLDWFTMTVGQAGVGAKNLLVDVEYEPTP